MIEIIAVFGSILSACVALVVALTSPRRIAVATTSYLALRNNDPELAIRLTQQVFHAPEEPSPIKDMLALLPKRKSDE